MCRYPCARLDEENVHSGWDPPPPNPPPPSSGGGAIANALEQRSSMVRQEDIARGTKEVKRQRINRQLIIRKSVYFSGTI